ncbi:dienelactone hydrolase family protein [Kitasatospora sp. NBC_00240]|uniref:dienelactone hydrolase family protein n=1 Tax=Kitasatospora sp. NBC_00240 TaxID=2903567 RepID=UPI002250D35D|nr:dienelactone hydrolase family protein [Kitasatospora sp. NBC_00240]MCX5214086.1 dienelactone hydrolase family protein [Kitasatospora sp. NBC_00240]
MPDQGGSRQNVTFPGAGSGAHDVSGTAGADGAGRQARGYLALPPQGVGPGIVVIQEWWGLTSHIATVTDRFAAEGFVALAPDLYGGATAHDRAEAARLQRELPVERAARDLCGAVDLLLGHPAVVGDAIGVVGFCMGGGFALVLAAQEGDRVAAAVPFYGLPRDPEFDYRGLTAHVLGHYGELDGSIPVAAVDETAIRIGEATDRRPEIHFYPAGHAFMNDENPGGRYDALQARIAWQRTLSFLWGHLG